MKTAVLLPQIPCLHFLFKEGFYVFSKARLAICDLLLVATNSKLPVFLFGRSGGLVSWFSLLLLLLINLILHRTYRNSTQSTNAVAKSLHFDGSFVLPSSGSVHRS
jgi:hypothetical protein